MDKKNIKALIKEKIKIIRSRKEYMIAFIVIVAMVLVTIASFFIYRKIEHSRIVKVSGTIEGDQVRISFRVEGQIIQLLVDEGYYVEIGNLVARLNTDELSRIRNEARASLKAGEYEYKLARIDYERAERLFEQGSVSTQERDRALTKFEAGAANVEELKAALELAETRLGFTDLQAPLSGFILAKSALAGEVVQIGAPVFTAIDLNDLWVTAYINESDLGRVKLDQKAYVMTDSYRHKRYRGWVSFISEQTEFTPKYIQTTEERVKYVYRIKVRVDNSSFDLKPGMPADAYIVIE